MKFKRSLWKGEFKSPTNLCCLLKGILYMDPLKLARDFDNFFIT